MIRAVLFDATGTLIELREPVGESYARFARESGVQLPAWRIEDGFRRILARSPARVFPDAAPGEVPARERDWWRTLVRDTFRAADQTVHFRDFDAFFEALFRWYAGAGAWRLRPGAREALAALRRRGLRLGVLSDFDQRLTRILDCLEISSFFDTVVLCGAHGVAKPDPRAFEAALSALGVPAAEAVYVGDDPDRDLAGARAAGLQILDARDLGTLAELPDRLATLPLPATTETR